MKPFKLFALLPLFTLLFVGACAPSKAYIDKTALGQIVWPGPPEKPRIQYLWSVTQISIEAKGRRGLSDFLLGDVEGDVTDPRTSNVLMRPYGVFVDSREKLYVADPGAYRVTVIDLKTMEVFHITGSEKNEFLSPVGVVADPSGRIYISDSELRRVFVFDEKGKPLSRFEGDFTRPTCLAIDTKNSTIYVSDTLEHKVYLYSPDGKRIGSIGRPGASAGEFNYPTHLFVDGSGLLYVTDAMNFRAQIFTLDGRAVGAVGSLGDSYADLDKPKGVAVDGEGHIYVVDSIKDMVKIFDREGNLLLFFGDRGKNYGDFWLPSGIFIDAHDTIYIADTYNGRVQVFQYVKEGNK